MIGRFFGQDLPLEFIDWEIRFRWNIFGDFHVSALSKVFLLFVCSLEEDKTMILEKESWSLAE